MSHANANQKGSGVQGERGDDPQHPSKSGTVDALRIVGRLTQAAWVCGVLASGGM